VASAAVSTDRVAVAPSTATGERSAEVEHPARRARSPTRAAQADRCLTFPTTNRIFGGGQLLVWVRMTDAYGDASVLQRLRAIRPRRRAGAGFWGRHDDRSNSNEYCCLKCRGEGADMLVKSLERDAWLERKRRKVTAPEG